jgi:DNA-binding NarL/FixJ family response regulator
MKKLVLVEKNHLIRLGLHKLFSSLSNEWEIVLLDVDDIHALPDTDRTADLVVLGLPVDASEGHQAMASIEHVLNPTNMLLLSEQSASWSPLDCGTRSIYACIDKKASTDTLLAAVRLGMSYEKFLSARAGAALEQKTLPNRVADAATVPNHASSHVDRTAEKNTQQPGTINHILTPAEHAGTAAPVSTQSLDKSGGAGRCGAELLNITPRQYEVLELLARGYPIKTVARMMDIATATAKAHTASLYRQLNVNSRGEAVYAARQKGVLLN